MRGSVCVCVMCVSVTVTVTVTETVTVFVSVPVSVSVWHCSVYGGVFTHQSLDETNSVRLQHLSNPAILGSERTTTSAAAAAAAASNIGTPCIGRARPSVPNLIRQRCDVNSVAAHQRPGDRKAH